MTESVTKNTEHYLGLFENAIAKHKEIVGNDEALDMARQAGLGVSPEGHIVSSVGHPVLVLLRLIKAFTKNAHIATLAECMPLIEEMEQLKELLIPIADHEAQN